VKALDTLVGTGLNLDQAISFLPSVMLTAQASGADPADMAKTSAKLSAALNIQAKDSQKAFDILVAGGKAGLFELKDMAQFIPDLASLFSDLGNEGTDDLERLVALLQVMITKTGSAASAATQLKNVMAKVHTAEQAKRFKEFGIDLTGELKKAQEQGETTIDAFVRLTKLAIKGDKTKLPLLFRDLELQQGMRALVSTEDAYKSLLTTIRNEKVSGGGLEDFNRVMGDTQAQIDRLSNNWDRLKTNLGGDIAVEVTPLLQNINEKFDRGRHLEVLRKEQAEIDKKNGIKDGAISEFFGSKIGVDRRLGERVLNEKGFEAFKSLPIENERKVEILIANGVKVKNFDLENLTASPSEINRRVGFDPEVTSNLKNDGIAKKFEILNPEFALAKVSSDASRFNTTNNNQGGSVTNHVSIEQNVSQASKAPGAALKGTQEALSRLNADRAQLQAEPAQP